MGAPGRARRAVLRRAATFAAKATPRLQNAAAVLPASSGVAPDAADAAEQRQRLDRYHRFLRDHVADLPVQPRLALFIPDAAAAAPHLLHETLRSVRFQLYPRWTVFWGAPEGSAQPATVLALASEFPGQVRRAAGGTVAQQWAAVIAEEPEAAPDYIAVLPAGDRMYPAALAEMVRAIDVETRLTGVPPNGLYSDERLLDANGARIGQPLFKPGWSPILLRSHNYVGGLAVYRRAAATAVSRAAWRAPGPAAPGDEPDDEPDHGPGDEPRSDRPLDEWQRELAERIGALNGLVLVPHLLFQRRLPAGHRTPADRAAGRPGDLRPALPLSEYPYTDPDDDPDGGSFCDPDWYDAHTLAENGDPDGDSAWQTSYATGPRPRTIGENDVARALLDCGALKAVDRSEPEPTDTVSIVIPTKDRADLLRACLASIAATDHPDYDVVVVDNGSTDPEAVDLLADLSGTDGVTVLHRPGPFNFARLCNAGVSQAGGDVVVLLNNDTEVLDPRWLTELTAMCADPGVGAVGAKLLYPDGRIQHAGLAGMSEAGTGHLFVARDPEKESPLGLADTPREVLAVTGACLAIRRDLYREVGGLDEVVVPNDSGDVDLCLRLREIGYANVYQPRAVLRHHESPSRGRSFVNFERFYLQRRWAAQLLCDPYLNPNLAKSSRYEPDPRFGPADAPPELFAHWLRAGTALD